MASPAKDLKVVELRNNGPEARQLSNLAVASRHRSVYLPLLRGLVPRPLEVFDFAEQGMVTGRRDTTTVATQALYLLNDPFVRRQSLGLAQRLLDRSDDDDTARINRAYRLTLARTATVPEIERALRYLSDFAANTGTVPASTPPAQPTLVAAADTGQGDAEAQGEKKKPPQNPDEMEQSDEPVRDEIVTTANPRMAAWTSFCQALLGSAEFQYLK